MAGPLVLLWETSLSIKTEIVLLGNLWDIFQCFCKLKQTLISEIQTFTRPIFHLKTDLFQTFIYEKKTFIDNKYII